MVQKQFSLIISLLILSIVIFIAYNVYDIDRKSRENQYNKLISDLNRDTTDFTSWISDKKETLNTAKDIVDNFAYEQIIRWKTLNPYLNINNDDPDISQIYIGLATGEFITGGSWVPPEDYDPRTRVWYKEAVAADSTIISDVYIDRETGDRTVTLSSTLYMEDRFVGVISADVFMDDISKWLTSQISMGNVYTYLLDSEGTIILHTLRPELVGTNLGRDREQYDPSYVQRDVLAEYFRKAGETNHIVRMEYVIDGLKTRGIIRKIEDGDWYLSVATIEDYNLARFIRLNARSVIFNLLILGIIFLLLMLVIRIKGELEKKNQLLVLDNERDFLTGIFNRRYFNLYMDNLWHRENENSPLSILMMDIDHFKGYNDTYGHIKGDEVLAAVTREINNTIRKEDVFSRYGGEEFVLVLNHVSTDDARRIAGKIVEAIYDRNIENRSSPNGRITISIGIASIRLSEKIDVRQFTNRADQALYKAKSQGRNRVEVYTGEPD